MILMKCPICNSEMILKPFDMWKCIRPACGNIEPIQIEQRSKLIKKTFKSLFDKLEKV